MPTVSGKFADLPGRGSRLHYRDWGGAGETLLLLHGLSSNSRIWDLTAPLLTDRFRVVAVDQRSHGLSDRTDDGYGFEGLSADIEVFLQVLGIGNPVLVGHSWGASVALHFAVSHPDSVRALVMVDGGFIDLSQFMPWDEAQRVMLPPDIDGTPVETFIEFMRKWPQFQRIWSEELAGMMLSNFDVKEGKIYRRLTIPDHMKIAQALYDLNAGELLARLTCPALALSCHRDPANPAEREWQSYRNEALARVKETAPLVRVQVMEDTIHDVPIQRPQELAAALLGFLGSGI